MRNLLALTALVLLVFLGLGWYLGWYKIQSTSTADGHRHIQIDVDANKVKTDVNKGETKLHDILTDRNDNGPQNGSTVNGTATSLRTGEDGSFVFPASGPSPPASGPTLPPAR
jgi:hypothetical protein